MAGYTEDDLVQIKTEKSEALSEIEKTYAGMAEQSDAFYDKQIAAAQDYADKQSAIQQEQTDFTIEQIEQQKAQAEKDYVKEQSGAYVDWRKQSGEYGVEAEKMASAGLKDTGYSETSQVAFYNTYQNRVATARESFNLAVINYNNAIKEARLQNNAALAEIAYQALQTQLELSLEGFQYKNSLILEAMNKKLEVEDMYDSRYQDVYDRIIAEEQWQAEYDLGVQELEEQMRQFDEEMARLRENDSVDNQIALEELTIAKEKLEMQKQELDASFTTPTTTPTYTQGELLAALDSLKSGSASAADYDILLAAGYTVEEINQLKDTGSKGILTSDDEVEDENESEINYASVVACGFPPTTSAETLAKLVANGILTYEVKDGKIVFSRVNKSTVKNTGLFGDGPTDINKAANGAMKV